jgi:pimeloyl-ACP methyl ester carboxylesterase
MPFAGVNGQRLYYEVGGEGDVVVLLHGFLADADSMEAPATGLATGLRAIRLDRRGHGRSNPVDHVPSIADEAADVAALLDWFSIDATHFVAHGEGAEVALQFALTYPSRTLSLVLLAPTMEGFFWSAEENVKREALLTALRTDQNKALVERWNTLRHFDIPEDRPEMGDRLRDLFSRVAGGVSAFPRPEHDGPAQAERLSEVKAKTAIYVGDRDDLERLRCAEQMADRIPGAVLVTFPGLSRFLHAEDSRAVMRRLTDFFMPEPVIER